MSLTYGQNRESSKGLKKGAQLLPYILPLPLTYRRAPKFPLGNSPLSTDDPGCKANIPKVCVSGSQTSAWCSMNHLAKSGGAGLTPRVDQGWRPKSLHFYKFPGDAAGLGQLVENQWPEWRDATDFTELASITWQGAATEGIRCGSSKF